MNRKKLFKELNTLCSDLDYSYDINNGGCCFVAACIAEQLERFNIPFKVVHYDLYRCHYAIKVSDRYINRSDYRKKEIVCITKWASTKLYDIYYDNSWNDTYNKQHNSIISRKIKKLFDENSRT